MRLGTFLMLVTMENGYRVIEGEEKYYTHGDGRDYFYVVKTPRGGIYRLDYFGVANEPL